MKSGHKHPKLIEIDAALSELMASIAGDVETHGYTIIRSHDGAFDVPHRRVQRVSRFEESEPFDLSHTMHVRVGVPISVRLERGYFAQLPLVIAVQAALKQVNPFSERTCYEALKTVPFCEAAADLPALFQEAMETHGKWDATFVARHGLSVDEM